MKKEMTDKERILMKIVSLTAYSTIAHSNSSDDSTRWEFVHNDTALNKGDIVLGMTNPNHPFAVAFFEERIDGDGLVVKEIGSEKLSSYTNERFLVLRNFPDMLKLCGVKRATMVKITKALAETDQFRFVRVYFESNKLLVTARKKWTDKLIEFSYEYSCPLSKITISSLKERIKSELDT